MSDCDALNPLFWDIAKSDDAACRPRRRPGPSFVEALAVVVVLMLLLAGNVERWTGDAKAGTPAAETALDDAGTDARPGD